MSPKVRFRRGLLKCLYAQYCHSEFLKKSADWHFGQTQLFFYCSLRKLKHHILTTITQTNTYIFLFTVLVHSIILNIKITLKISLKRLRSLFNLNIFFLITIFYLLLFLPNFSHCTIIKKIYSTTTLITLTFFINEYTNVLQLCNFINSYIRICILPIYIFYSFLIHIEKFLYFSKFYYIIHLLFITIYLYKYS